MSENKTPTCVGTGLIALDMVFNGDRGESPRFWAGGSCGNVLTILAYLAWHSYPVARFGDDEAAIERDYPVVYAEPIDYTVDFDELDQCDDDSSRIVHVWLYGNVYP